MACLVNSLGKLTGGILDEGGSNRIREDSDKSHSQISEEQNPKKESLEYVIISSDEEDIDPGYYVNQTQSLEYVIIHSDEDEIEYPGISIVNQTQTDNSHEETSENKSKDNQDQNPIQTDISHEETTENESKDHQDQNPTQADNNHEETTENKYKDNQVQNPKIDPTTFPDVNEKEKPPKVTLSNEIHFFDENDEDDDDNAKNYDDQNDISHEVGKEEEDGPKVKSKDDPKNDPNSDRDGSGVDDDDVYLASLDKDEIDEIIQDVFL